MIEKLKGVILVNPTKHVNVGSVARSMLAFGCENLIIVDKPKHLSLPKAIHISKQGERIIKNALFVDSLSDIVGTKVATISAQDNIKHGVPTTSLKDMSWPDEFYLVMGRESCGLTMDELMLCNVAVSIPTNGKYGILNLSHATTIILYELFCS